MALDRTYNALFRGTGNSARSILTGMLIEHWDWDVPDPAAVIGPEADRRHVFFDAFLALDNRIKIFALPLDKLDRMGLKRSVDEIGRLRTVPK